MNEEYEDEWWPCEECKYWCEGGELVDGLCPNCLEKEEEVWEDE